MKIKETKPNGASHIRMGNMAQQAILVALENGAKIDDTGIHDAEHHIVILDLR